MPYHLEPTQHLVPTPLTTNRPSAGPWSTDDKWFGAAARFGPAAVPAGWTLAPALAYLAPSALRHITANS